MLISSAFLKSAIDNYRKTAKHPLKTFILILAILFFVFELFILYYAIKIAQNCTQGGAQRVFYIILAVLFTTPYTLFLALFSSCNYTEEIQFPLSFQP